MAVQRRFGALAFLLLLVAAGCAHPSKIAFRYGPDGSPASFVRRERYIARDFLHHLTREDYERPAAGIDGDLSADQRIVAQHNGPPDWTREFASFEDEHVEEWIYIDKSLVAQFIDGLCVFQGPLTDYEQILLTHGRPSRAINHYSDTGSQVDIFVYDSVFLPEIQQYHFLNGKLTEKQEGD